MHCMQPVSGTAGWGVGERPSLHIQCCSLYLYPHSPGIQIQNTHVKFQECGLLIPLFGPYQISEHHLTQVNNKTGTKVTFPSVYIPH